MQGEELVVVYDAADEVRALLYRTMLEEAGIDVFERPMEEDWLEGVKLRGLHSQLLVAGEDAERARQLVRAFHEEAEKGELAAGLPGAGARDSASADSPEG